MLIRLAKARRCMSLRDAASAARDAGRNYITIASEYLGQVA
jgi:PTS system mannose-specific IIA component